MSRVNKLLDSPPHTVEQSLRILGDNLRTARLRRNMTIAVAAERIGAGPRAVMDAEKGKISTSVGIYAGLLWLYGLLDPLASVADPGVDREGAILARQSERRRARVSSVAGLDNDF